MDTGLILDGIGVLGGLGVGYSDNDGAGRSPGADNGTTGADMLSALDLEMGGACGMSGVAMAIPLARPVRLAIPGYVEVYWSQVHPQLPIVHRPSFEDAPQDILRCAMAAVATQYLNGRDDRIRGNQLHEYAWQEAKRVSPSNPYPSETVFCMFVFRLLTNDQTKSSYFLGNAMGPANHAGNSPM